MLSFSLFVSSLSASTAVVPSSLIVDVVGVVDVVQVFSYSCHASSSFGIAVLHSHRQLVMIVADVVPPFCCVLYPEPVVMFTVIAHRRSSSLCLSTRTASMSSSSSSFSSVGIASSSSSRRCRCRSRHPPEPLLLLVPLSPVVLSMRPIRGVVAGLPC